MTKLFKLLSKLLSSLYKISTVVDAGAVPPEVTMEGSSHEAKSVGQN